MRKKLCLVLNLSLILFVSSTSTSPAPAAEVAAKELHRMDCRLEHVSCATCILKVRTALRATAGVVKCEISLRKPFGAVVIFEPNKVQVEQMKTIAKQADPRKHVEFADVLDKPIGSMPTLLIPIYNSLKKDPSAP